MPDLHHGASCPASLVEEVASGVPNDYPALQHKTYAPDGAVDTESLPVRSSSIVDGVRINCAPDSPMGSSYAHERAHRQTSACSAGLPPTGRDQRRDQRPGEDRARRLARPGSSPPDLSPRSARRRTPRRCDGRTSILITVARSTSAGSRVRPTACTTLIAARWRPRGACGARYTRHCTHVLH
jgi:hypothetical protein